jgi:hypothetical protein
MLGLALVFVAASSVQSTDIWDRDRLISALTELIRTGEPRHVNHDEGQELWEALQPRLRLANDTELIALATRAAIPIVVTIHHPIGSTDEMPRLTIGAGRVLPLPWRVRFTATIETSVDGDDWRSIVTIASESGKDVRLDTVLRANELKPGFHMMRVRANISYDQAPIGMARHETRPLQTLAYAVQGAGATETEAATIEAAIRHGRFVPLSTLDLTMPDVPLARWLAHFERDVFWHIEWCDEHAHPGAEQPFSPDVCVVSTTATSAGYVANIEVWVKIGSLLAGSAGPVWTDSLPSLAASYLFLDWRTPVTLRSIESLIAAPKWTWPVPKLVVSRADITTTPVVPRLGQRTIVHVTVSNIGSATAYGVHINVWAGSPSTDLARQFVRDIPAGERIEFSIDVDFASDYGWVEVWALQMSEHHDGLQPLGDPSDAMAIALINRDVIPPPWIDYACRNAVGHFPCSE